MQPSTKSRIASLELDDTAALPGVLDIRVPLEATSITKYTNTDHTTPTLATLNNTSPKGTLGSTLITDQGYRRHHVHCAI
jgi:hypothetical protein